MTNVLYVIWSLGLGGAEQIVVSLAKGLDKSRFRPHVACLNDEGRFAEELKREGIPVFSLHKAKGLDFSVVPKLAGIIRENDIHVVHAHLWGANFWGRLAARAAGVPAVVTEHGLDTWKTPFHFLVDRWLFRRTACLIAVSEAVRGFYAQKLGVAKERMSVVYNGVATGRPEQQASSGSSAALRREFGIRDGERVISLIGRLVPLKGIAFFLEAFSRLDGNDRALIVGDGPLLEKLKAHAAGLNLGDKVIFAGFRRDVPELLGITDVLALTSSREGLPMIILEAMAAGVVVVATRVGGVPELVQDDETGFLVDYGDVESLRNRLAAVLSKSDLTSVRERAKIMVEEKFSLAAMIKEHEGIYSRVCRVL